MSAWHARSWRQQVSLLRLWREMQRELRAAELRRTTNLEVERLRASLYSLQRPLSTGVGAAGCVPAAPAAQCLQEIASTRGYVS